MLTFDSDAAGCTLPCGSSDCTQSHLSQSLITQSASLSLSPVPPASCQDPREEQGQGQSEWCLQPPPCPGQCGPSGPSKSPQLTAHASHSQNERWVTRLGENWLGWVAGPSSPGFHLPCCRQTVASPWGSLVQLCRPLIQCISSYQSVHIFWTLRLGD